MAELFDRFANISSGERARRRIDLIVVSVLLDAGAGPSWQYKDIETGLIFGRSEGLALASLRLIQSGILSIYGDEDPVRVDAERLINITSLELRSVFQVSNKNDLIGLEERTGLLNQLGKVMKQPESIFRQNNEIRPGNLYDHMTASNNNGEIKARDILIVLLKELGTIWPDGGKIGSLPIGDVGEHPSSKRDNETNRIVPFHKLSQWMTYSLIEPFQEAGISVIDMNDLTGLAEYRNGGLFIDTGVLRLKNSDYSAIAQELKNPLVVEWRAMTLALLDRVAMKVRLQTGDNPDSLPLTSVLQGGTWIAGRRIAERRRAGGPPPITLVSAGTIF